MILFISLVCVLLACILLVANGNWVLAAALFGCFWFMLSAAIAFSLMSIVLIVMLALFAVFIVTGSYLAFKYD